MLLDLPIEIICYISSFLGNDIRFLFTYKILYDDQEFWKNLIKITYPKVKEVNHKEIYFYLKSQLVIRDKVQFVEKNPPENEEYWQQKLKNKFKLPGVTFRDLYLALSKKLYLRQPPARIQFFSNFKDHCKSQNHQKSSHQLDKDLKPIKYLKTQSNSV